MAGPLGRMRRRPATVAVAGVFVVLSVALVAVLVGTHLLRRELLAGPPPGPDIRSQGRDALWLGHRRIDGRANRPGPATAGRAAADSGVADVYVHVGPLAGGMPSHLRRWFEGAS